MQRPAPLHHRGAGVPGCRRPHRPPAGAPGGGGWDLPTLSALLQRLAEGPDGGVALHGDVLAEAVVAVQQATGAGGTEEEWLAWETAAAASPDARLRRGRLRL